VLRKLLISGLAAACVLAPAAAAQAPLPLLPGVTYEQEVQFTPRGPVALHVVRAPRPVGLYALRPLLSNEAILGTETVTAMQRRVAPQLTAVSLNGDATVADGRPAGIVIRDGALDHGPAPGRSSAGIDAQGTLRIDRVSLAGTWQGTGQRRPLAGVNQPPAAGQVVLFTSAWGGVTPRTADAVDAVLTPFPPASPGADLAGTVTQLVPGGGTAIPPGSAVLQARGAAIAPKLQAEAPAGTAATVRLLLRPAWSGVAQAIGGGPVLVRDGKAVFRANEAFDTADLLAREPRSAVAQLADGSLLLVAVDGDRPGYSIGISSFQLALALQRLGAVRALALASGNAAELAFDGTLLSRPPVREQPLADALTLAYYGVYAPPLETPLSELSYRLVRHSTVRAALSGPGGIETVVDEGPRDPGSYRFPFAGVDANGAPLVEGTWRWTVAATDDTGAASTADRSFTVDRTLGPAKVARAGRTVTVSTELSRAAALTLEVETPLGVVVATATARAAAGPASVSWDGRVAGSPAPAGRYVAHLVAKSAVGTSDVRLPFALAT
jgi:hypothetical protein